uniref:Uncharacterized protein n=1 Tax=Oryza punctata TaxID=4537 RepID=A0A0E0LM50_ORYPU
MPPRTRSPPQASQVTPRAAQRQRQHVSVSLQLLPASQNQNNFSKTGHGFFYKVGVGNINLATP